MIMKKYVYLVPLFLTFMACEQPNYNANGPAYDVLTQTKYDELQQHYQQISDFENGTAIVKRDSSWGLIDSRGKEVLSSEYDTIFPLIHNYRAIKHNSKYGLANKLGEIVVPCKYEGFYGYRENLYCAFKQNGKWGFVDSCNNVVVQFKYDDIYPFFDSIFVAQIKNKYGMYDFKGNTIIKPEYDFIAYKIYGEEAGISYAKNGDKFAIINSDNKVVSKCEYDIPAIPSGQYVTFAEYHNDRYCMVNWETGEVCIPYGYEDLGDYSEGLVYAKKNGKYGYINANNEIVIPFKYTDAENFSEGLAMVGVDNGYRNCILGPMHTSRYGFIDKNGEFIIKPTFADQSINSNGLFKEGLAIMGVERSDNIFPDEYGFIDKTGKWVIKPIYKELDHFKDGVAIVKTKYGYGAINKLGEIIVSPEYEIYESRNWHEDKIVFKNENGDKFEFTLEGVAL